MTGRARLVLLGGLAALGVGMVLVSAGVAIGALFVPGVFLLGAGLLTSAAAGVMSLVGARADDA